MDRAFYLEPITGRVGVACGGRCAWSIVEIDIEPAVAIAEGRNALALDRQPPYHPSSCKFLLPSPVARELGVVCRPWTRHESEH